MNKQNKGCTGPAIIWLAIVLFTFLMCSPLIFVQGNLASLGWIIFIAIAALEGIIVSVIYFIVSSFNKDKKKE
jgi:hypothetical protein